jgi:type I restriction enzyme S subunit
MKCNLTEASLAEVCCLVTDGTHDTPQRVPSGFPLIKAKEIVTGQIDFSSCDKISETEHRKVIARSKPEFGDTLFTHIGASLGAAAYVNTTREFSIKNIALFKPNPAIIDARYLYYVVISPEFQSLAIGTKTGSAQPFLGLSQLRGHRIHYHPDIPIQRRIAGILSAYDELIENSQRRIKILEQMARSLYREWFVHFRYPGHENVPLVPSPLGEIPQGWEVLEFRHLFDIRYGKTLPKTEISESGAYPVYGAGDVIGYYDKILWPYKCALVTSRGNGSGTVWRTRGAAFVTNNSLIMLPRDDRSYWDYSFVELLLKHANVMEAKTGSAQPQVTIENLNYVKAIVPTKQLVEKCCATVTPINERVDSLFQQIQNLRRTRDLLLPRLLSGQIDVEAMPS